MLPMDVLAVVTSSKQESVFAMADSLAAKSGGHVTVLYLARQPEPLDANIYYAASLWAELLEEARKSFAVERAAIEKRLTEMQSRAELRQEEVLAATVEGVVSRHAMHADLCVLPVQAEEALSIAFEGALFGSGRPVLLAPPAWREALGKNVVVAWKAKREAARALGDALPLLPGAEKITVITVDARPDGYGEGPGRDICTHLARKGLDVELRNVDGGGRPAETAILHEARALNADLIVLGGYGHSRAREYVFGGVTRALTRMSTIPLLLSH